jgi:hypothetical protein
MSLEEFVEFMEDSAILQTHVQHDENDEVSPCLLYLCIIFLLLFRLSYSLWLNFKRNWIQYDC